MLDGESVLQSQGDMYVVRVINRGPSKKILAMCIIFNIFWISLTAWGFIYTRQSMRDEIRTVMAEEVPDMVRVVLMP